MAKRAQKRTQRGFIGSVGILALLEHQTEGGWTAESLAKVCGLKPDTVRHHLDRLRGYKQVVGKPNKRPIAFRLNSDASDRPDRQIEVRTLVWTVTEKGSRRLEIRGGHDDWCPNCGSGK